MSAERAQLNTHAAPAEFSNEEKLNLMHMRGLSPASMVPGKYRLAVDDKSCLLCR